jgi:hypothetical protein
VHKGEDKIRAMAFKKEERLPEQKGTKFSISDDDRFSNLKNFFLSLKPLA